MTVRGKKEISMHRRQLAPEKETETDYIHTGA